MTLFERFCLTPNHPHDGILPNLLNKPVDLYIFGLIHSKLVHQANEDDMRLTESPSNATNALSQHVQCHPMNSYFYGDY